MAATTSIACDLARREQRGGRGARTGLILVCYWLLELGRTDSDVIGLEVDGRTVARKACETLDELEERANPRGSWRALPWPVCEQVDHALQPAEWAAAIELAKDRGEISDGSHTA